MLEQKTQQEVGWIQQRMTWLATFQGLLFATFGLLYQTSAGTGLHPPNKAILFAIAAVGLLTCICIMAGLHSASTALGQIKGEWERLVADESTRMEFPEFRTEKKARLIGMISSWGPTVLFAFAWLAIMLFTWIS